MPPMMGTPGRQPCPNTPAGGGNPLRKKRGAHKRDQDLTKNNYRSTLDLRIEY